MDELKYIDINIILNLLNADFVKTVSFLYFY